MSPQLRYLGFLVDLSQTKTKSERNTERSNAVDEVLYHFLSHGVAKIIAEEANFDFFWTWKADDQGDNHYVVILEYESEASEPTARVLTGMLRQRLNDTLDRDDLTTCGKTPCGLTLGRDELIKLGLDKSKLHEFQVQDSCNAVATSTLDTSAFPDLPPSPRDTVTISGASGLSGGDNTGSKVHYSDCRGMFRRLANAYEAENSVCSTTVPIALSGATLLLVGVYFLRKLIRRWKRQPTPKAECTECGEA